MRQENNNLKTSINQAKLNIPVKKPRTSRFALKHQTKEERQAIYDHRSPAFKARKALQALDKDTYSDRKVRDLSILLFVSHGNNADPLLSRNYYYINTRTYNPYVTNAYAKEPLLRSSSYEGQANPTSPRLRRAGTGNAEKDSTNFPLSGKGYPTNDSKCAVRPILSKCIKCGIVSHKKFRYCNESLCFRCMNGDQLRSYHARKKAQTFNYRKVEEQNARKDQDYAWQYLNELRPDIYSKYRTYISPEQIEKEFSLNPFAKLLEHQYREQKRLFRDELNASLSAKQKGSTNVASICDTGQPNSLGKTTTLGLEALRQAAQRKEQMGNLNRTASSLGDLLLKYTS